MNEATQATTRIIHFGDADFTDPNTIYIGREVPRKKLKRSPWANPFRFYSDKDRVATVATFRLWVKESDEPRAVWIRAHLEELRGKTLVCWCKDKEHPDRACHGDVYREMLGEIKAA